MDSIIDGDTSTLYYLKNNLIFKTYDWNFALIHLVLELYISIFSSIVEKSLLEFVAFSIEIGPLESLNFIGKLEIIHIHSLFYSAI